MAAGTCTLPGTSPYAPWAFNLGAEPPREDSAAAGGHMAGEVQCGISALPLASCKILGKSLQALHASVSPLGER